MILHTTEVTAYDIDSQNYRLFIGAIEKREWLTVFLYGPMGTRYRHRARLRKL